MTKFKVIQGEGSTANLEESISHISVVSNQTFERVIKKQISQEEFENKLQMIMGLLGELADYAVGPQR